MNTSTRNLIIVATVLIVGVIVVVIGFGSYYNDCDQRFADLEERRASLEIRSDSLGGRLDFGGELRAEINQYDTDVSNYNNDCT